MHRIGASCEGRGRAGVSPHGRFRTAREHFKCRGHRQGRHTLLSSNCTNRGNLLAGKLVFNRGNPIIRAIIRQFTIIPSNVKFVKRFFKLFSKYTKKFVPTPPTDTKTTLFHSKFQAPGNRRPPALRTFFKKKRVEIVYKSQKMWYTNIMYSCVNKKGGSP